MRDDLLKEQLMSYARTAADAASQPGAAAIRRRARRHAQRVAALTVAGVLVAVGLGVGIGLRRDHTTPTVDRPKPPVTSLAPVKPPATTPAPTPTSTPHPTTTTGPVAAGPPPSFVTLVGSPSPSAPPPRVAVVATSTGRVVRYLTGPAPAGGDWPTRPALSPDRAWVYYSLTGAGGRAATYRVPFGGGPATKVTGTVGISLAVSPDGSKLLLDARNGPRWRYGLVVRDLASGRERFMAFPFPQAGDIFGLAWSPDSRQVALVRGPITDNERFPTQLFVLEVASGHWRTAVSFDAGGPAPIYGELGLAWPAPRRVAFVARVADSDTAPGRYRLVVVDPRTGKLTPLAVLASDPSAIRGVRTRLLDFDAGGRYLLYGVDGPSLTTRWLDTSGKRAPVEIGRFNALSDTETHAYEAGAW
jgi:hypothetical protein